MIREELFNFCKKIISKVPKGDIICFYSEEVPVDFMMDKLKSIEDNQRFSIGLRIFKDGKVGNSYINTLEDEDLLIKNAYESVQYGDQIDFELPENNSIPDIKLYYDEVINLPKENLLDTCFNIYKRLKKIDKNAKIDISINKSFSETILMNTSGFCGSYKETNYSISANMILVEDGGGLLYVSDSDFSYNLDLNIDDIINNIEFKYKNALKKCKVKSGYFPVLFTPESLSLLLDPIEISANGKSVYKGISKFIDKIDTKLVSDKFSLYDDPFIENGGSNYPFDDEGIIPSKLTIFENGVFKNFIYDLATAKRLNKFSTGHAQRSVSSLPAPTFSNLIISKGDSNLDDMIKNIDYGLLVYEFLGEGMSNVIAGDFSVNVELGYLIEKGKIKGRVKDVMMAGNSFDLLNNIAAVENKLYKTGSLFAPHILINNVSIVG